MPQLGISSWAVHDWVGQDFPSSPETPVEPSAGKLGKLLEFPKRAKEVGASYIEVCHFHLPLNTEELLKLRKAADEAGIKLFQLLIDSGDITHPDHGERDLQWIETWIEAAAVAGFERVRIIAGKQEATPETLDKSVDGLRRLVTYAAEDDVKVSTENWFSLLSKAEAVNHVLEEVPNLGLALDFGNWGETNKVERLAEIASLATSCHAKCEFHDGRPDLETFEECLSMAVENGFRGGFTLVHPEPSDEWEGLVLQIETVRKFL